MIELRICIIEFTVYYHYIKKPRCPECLTGIDPEHFAMLFSIPFGISHLGALTNTVSNLTSNDLGSEPECLVVMTNKCLMGDILLPAGSLPGVFATWQ